MTLQGKAIPAVTIVDGQSEDLVEVAVETLRSAFPSVVSEGRVDFEALRQLLGEAVEEGSERYGLSWAGKRRARRLALTPSTGTLLPAPADSLNWNSARDFVCEGDNLEVLKILQKSYAGKVKLIYIDPPYNTGKDFVYPDDYTDSITNYMYLTGQIEGGVRYTSNPESSGRFHTDWLNLMYPRLMLARNLLSENGWIAVSCDDAELPRVRQIVEEVFGEENFITNIIWQKKYTRANDAKFFSDNHDYVVVACRSSERATLGAVARGDAQNDAYTNPDDHPKGAWKATPLHARSGSNREPYRFQNGIVWRPPVGTYRRFNDKAMRALEEDDAIWFGSRGDQTPSRKTFLSEVGDGLVPVTIWDHKFAGNNHDASNELKQLDLAGAFTSPKPTLLIRRLLELMTSPDANDLVLDFFAGSGTTGHAVMAQNAADGGNRRYMLVQLPEPLDPANKDQKVAAQLCDTLGKPRTIAEITKERLRRAAAKLMVDAAESASELGFRTYKLASSNLKVWAPGDDLEKDLLSAADNLARGRTEDDLLVELLLKQGIDLAEFLHGQDN